jgi:hypothetical protein
VHRERQRLGAARVRARLAVPRRELSARSRNLARGRQRPGLLDGGDEVLAGAAATAPSPVGPAGSRARHSGSHRPRDGRVLPVPPGQHLGQDNVEVLSNSVSASSHKLTAYNTISSAIETSWKGGPVTAADVEAQSSWLISAWDSLVKVRPEYGKLSTPARQEQRLKTISSSAVVIYGLIGAMSAMYTDHVDPDVAFKAIAAQGDDDLLSWHNPVWVTAGVVTPSGSGTGALSTRNSFPARRAAIRVLREAMSLGVDTAE